MNLLHSLLLYLADDPYHHLHLLEKYRQVFLLLCLWFVQIKMEKFHSKVISSHTHFLHPGTPQQTSRRGEGRYGGRRREIDDAFT